jgi:hypothetical protein
MNRQIKSDHDLRIWLAPSQNSKVMATKTFRLLTCEREWYNPVYFIVSQYAFEEIVDECCFPNTTLRILTNNSEILTKALIRSPEDAGIVAGICKPSMLMNVLH